MRLHVWVSFLFHKKRVWSQTASGLFQLLSCSPENTKHDRNLKRASSCIVSQTSEEACKSAPKAKKAL